MSKNTYAVSKPVKTARGETGFFSSNGEWVEYAGVLVRDRIVTEYDLLLNGDITEHNAYLGHYEVFLNASPEDVIHLNITTNGGVLHVAQEYVNYMSRCLAPIVGYVGTNCASAGSYIALHCDSWVLNKMSCLLVHDFSDAVVGTRHSKTKQMKEAEIFHDIFVNTYKDFLTEEQMKAVLGGEDVVLNADELAKQLTAFKEKRDICAEDDISQDEFYC